MPSTSRLTLHPATSPAPAGRNTCRLNRLGLSLLSLASWILSHMAAGIRRFFDLPADVVEKSLKRLSTQSSLNGLFQANALPDVQTQSVRNAFEPHHALDGMLPGTRPGMFQEPGSGAPTVKKIGARMCSSPSLLHKSPAFNGQNGSQASCHENGSGMRCN